MYRYEDLELTAIIHKEKDGGYWGWCLEIPEAISQGETWEEMLANLKEAILLVIESRLEDTYVTGKEHIDYR